MHITNDGTNDCLNFVITIKVDIEVHRSNSVQSLHILAVSIEIFKEISHLQCIFHDILAIAWSTTWLADTCGKEKNNNRDMYTILMIYKFLRQCIIYDACLTLNTPIPLPQECVKNVLRTYNVKIRGDVRENFQFFPNLGAQHDRPTNIGRY